MKKFLAVAAMVLGIFLAQVSQAEAAEAYMGTWEGGWKAYLTDVGKMTNNASETEYYLPCTLKAVSPRGMVKFINYKFTMHYRGEDLSYISFVDSEGGSGSFTETNPGVYQVEHNVITSIFKAVR